MHMKGEHWQRKADDEEGYEDYGDDRQQRRRDDRRRQVAFSSCSFLKNSFDHRYRGKPFGQPA